MLDLFKQFSPISFSHGNKRYIQDAIDQLSKIHKDENNTGTSLYQIYLPNTMMWTRCLVFINIGTFIWEQSKTMVVLISPSDPAEICLSEKNQSMFG